MNLVLTSSRSAFFPYRSKKLLLLPALVGAADFLLFGHRLGFNLFLFVIVIAAGIALSGKGRHRVLRAGLGMAATSIAGIPLVLEPTLAAIVVSLSVLVLMSLFMFRLLPSRPEAVASVFLRFLAQAPLGLRRLARKRRPPSQDGSQRLRTTSGALRLWIMPLALTALFVGLFAIANPLVALALGNIDLWRLLDLFDVWRILFWLAAAACIWLLLHPRLKRRNARQAATAEPVEWDSSLFGEASLIRALALFNAVFAVETLLDMIYLWGGAGLPAGVSHAEYAHRGAYPLVATALLAAAFVLVAMRRGGPGERSPLVRKLVYLWIAQNVLLCFSAILRLDLYVEVYSLTWLRVAAGIWMGLVAIGLGLILLRIWLRRSNAWLVAMNLLSLLLVLYVSAFINFPALIARFNVDHSLEVSGEGRPLDFRYLARLGPEAIPAMDNYIAAPQNHQVDSRRVVENTRRDLQWQFENRPRGWRSWTYRQSRLADYLSAPQSVANSDGNDNNTSLNKVQE
ncbi:DUF4153 domain-containing protein [Rhizobium sp. PAMB 3182]